VAVAIAGENRTGTFGAVTAVGEIPFSVEDGEVFGVPEGGVRDRVERSLQAIGLQESGDDRVGDSPRE